RQRIHTLFHCHDQFGVRSLDRDSAAPDSDAVLDPAIRIGGAELKLVAVTQDQAHPFENKGAILAPLVGVLRRDQVLDGAPVFRLNSVEEIFRVAKNLAFLLPQPDAIETNRDAGGASY